MSDGNFPTYISNRSSFETKKKDDNIFFAALINYTIGQQASSLSPADRLLADSIRQRSAHLYAFFKNKKGRLTYNFWRTDSSFSFPYTKWISRVKKNTALPDDMDDTVLSLLAQSSDSTTAAATHVIMQEYVNEKNQSKTIEKKYRRFKTYSVWYGKNFPPVYDVCVLSNILCFVQQYHLTWTAADSAALQLIVHCIQTGDYLKKSLLISPYYGNTTLILYHLARLMKEANLPPLEALKERLITSAVQQMWSTDDGLQKVMLSSAIMKWNYMPPNRDLFSENLLPQTERSDFPFFTGNIPSYFSPPFKRIFLQKRWLLFYHYCPAFNDALLLEYLLLKKTLPD